MALLYKIALNDDDSSSCFLEDCGLADTYALSYEYATDNDKWAQDFVAIYQELIERGYSEGDLNELE